MELARKLKGYYAVAVLGLVSALVGFTYNTWRMEVSEDNNNVRTAAFEVLTQLAELEQLIYAAHYDQNEVAGNPRTGWVKIGLIADLSSLISPSANQSAAELKTVWAGNWQKLSEDRQAVDELVSHIDAVRDDIKQRLLSLL